MRSATFRAAAIVALVSSAQAQAAATKAASDCLSPEEVHAMVAYFLPSALDATISTCNTHLPADSFLRSKGPALVQTLSGGKDAAWPMAKSAFGKFGGNGKKDKLIDGMDDAIVRPFIEAAVTSELAPAIKPTNCKDINRIAATLEPLPAGNMVDLVAEILAVAARGDRKMATCPAE